MMTTLPAIASSSLNVRPRRGRAPTTSSVPGVTSDARPYRQTGVRPDDDRPPSERAADGLEDAAVLPGSPDCPGRTAVRVLAANIHVGETIGILERDRPQEQRIEDAERRGRQSNGQREHRDSTQFVPSLSCRDA